MAIVLNGTTGITAPDISVTAQSTDIVTTGDITAVDATLSGGVYLGGTGAANYLDDYEEGTWTPVVNYQNADDNTNKTIVFQYGFYTKVGNIVFAQFSVKWSATDPRANDNIRVDGFPFTSSAHAPSGNDMGFSAVARIENTSISAGEFYQIFLGANSTLSTIIRGVTEGNTGDQLGQNSNMLVKGMMTYRTDA